MDVQLTVKKYWPWIVGGLLGLVIMYFLFFRKSSASTSSSGSSLSSYLNAMNQSALQQEQIGIAAEQANAAIQLQQQQVANAGLAIQYQGQTGLIQAESQVPIAILQYGSNLAQNAMTAATAVQLASYQAGTSMADTALQAAAASEINALQGYTSMTNTLAQQSGQIAQSIGAAEPGVAYASEKSGSFSIGYGPFSFSSG